MNKDLLVLLEVVLIAMLLMPLAGAVCSLGGCCGSGNDDWQKSAQNFLTSDVPLVGLNQSNSVQTSSFRAGVPAGTAVKATGSKSVPIVAASFAEPESRTDSFPAGDILKPMEGFSDRDVVVDVSNQRSDGDAHIKGAIVIPVKSFFFDDGTLRPASETAAIFGAAGISPKDAVIVYSDSFGSGEATFVLWLLRYLGQDDAKALDGGLEDWVKASLSLETKKNVRSPVDYSPSPRSELLASYDLVKSGAAQMITSAPPWSGMLCSSWVLTPGFTPGRIGRPTKRARVRE